MMRTRTCPRSADHVQVDLDSGSKLFELPGSRFVERGAVTPGTDRNLDLDGGGTPGGRKWRGWQTGRPARQNGADFFNPVDLWRISTAGAIHFRCVANPFDLRSC